MTPVRPYSPVTNLGLSSSSDVIAFDQNWHHLYPTSASQNFDFCACPSHNALKSDAGGKKGKLLCCKHIFDWIKGNLAKIQSKNDQNVQKKHFF